ncbi:MAG: transcription elongation factor GreA [Rikenellaceae bacterium]
MMNKINHVTAEGMKKLTSDLDALRAQRPVISAMIAEARDKGDLSENAEYDAAKEAQGLLEMRIAKLEAVVASSRIIDASKLSTKNIQILTKVSLRNTATKKEFTYQIVSESEANIKEGKLSVGTPIAKALLGKKKGAVVQVTVPSGVMELEVLDISI